MRVATNVIACLGFLGAASLTPAIAAAPNAGPTGSNVTSVEPNTPSMSRPSHQPSHAAPLHSVALLQESLDSVGANVRVDGMWGPATAAALRHYQRQNGLQVTSQLDQATRTRLDPIG